MARFCWRCGHRLGSTPPVRCDSCGQEHYLNPKPCGEAVVEHNGRVLLIRRAREPWRDHWDVPGGFCEQGEHPMRAAERELDEETGLAGEAIAHIGIWMDRYGPPADDGVQEMTANVAYLVRLTRPDAPVLLDHAEANESGWFAFDELPSNLAFPGHARAMLSAAHNLLLGERAAAPLVDRSWGATR